MIIESLPQNLKTELATILVFAETLTLPEIAHRLRCLASRIEQLTTVKKTDDFSQVAWDEIQPSLRIDP